MMKRSSNTLPLPVCIALATLVAAARPAWPVTPISYSGTVSGQTVTFAGQRNVANVSGSLTVSGATVNVTAALAVDGSVSGVVTLPDGTSLGTFSARSSSGGNLTVTYSVAGNTGTVTTAMPSGLIPQAQ